MERVNFFEGQRLTAEDLQTEQEWVREKHRRHNRNLHGWGVVSGLEVQAPTADDPPNQVTIRPGYAVTQLGDEICVGERIRLDMAAAPPHDDGRTIYVALRYVETPTRPVPIPSGGADLGTVHARTREGFEVQTLRHLPESHDSWVVLAGVRLPAGPNESVTNSDISYEDRRMLALDPEGK